MLTAGSVVILMVLLQTLLIRPTTKRKVSPISFIKLLDTITHQLRVIAVVIFGILCAKNLL